MRNDPGLIQREGLDALRDVFYAEFPSLCIELINIFIYSLMNGLGLLILRLQLTFIFSFMGR